MPELQTTTGNWAGGTSLENIALPGAEEVEYSYFASGIDKGKLQSVTTSDATLTFSYDGSLLTAEQWSGGVSGTVTHGYDDRFRTNSLQVNALPEVEFGYDGDGLLIQAGDLGLTRDAATGFLTATALPASSPEVTDSTTYSAFAELASYTATYSGGTYSYTIESRDKLGRITEKTETIGGVTTQYEYSYDAAGRLEEVTVDASVAATYHYDANGNRTAHDGPGGTPIATAQYDAQDRLREYGATVYEYTESGELLSKTDGSDTTTFTYDALGNLRHFEGPGGTPEIEYLVDGRNRRIGKKLNGVLVKRWLYQDQLNPIAEVDAAGNVAQFVYGSKGNVPDYMVRYDSGGTEIGTYRILSDHLGSVRLVIDTSDGTIVQRIDYDEFGVVLNDTNPGFQPFGFAGGIWDGDTGLVRFGARDYDPIIGRWTSKDPIRFGGGDSNLYGYVLNDPVTLSDVSGLTWIYSQSSGQISHQPESGGPPFPLAEGYSGYASGLNNPGQQDVPNVGPIPQGSWKVGAPYNSPNVGPYALRLTPDPTTNTFGRTDFLIHGDNSCGCQSASRGCIVIPRSAREQIWRSGDRALQVVP